MKPFFLKLTVLYYNMSTSPLGNSLDPWDIVIRNSPWNCYIESWIPDFVPACFQLLMIFSLRERRELPMWLGSILVGSLSSTLSSSCWLECLWKSSSHACSSAVMEDCSTGSTSQIPRSDLNWIFRLLTSYIWNVCCESLHVVTTGVRSVLFWTSTMTFARKCNFLSCPSTNNDC